MAQAQPGLPTSATSIVPPTSDLKLSASMQKEAMDMMVAITGDDETGKWIQVSPALYYKTFPIFIASFKTEVARSATIKNIPLNDYETHTVNGELFLVFKVSRTKTANETIEKAKTLIWGGETTIISKAINDSVDAISAIH